MRAFLGAGGSITEFFTATPWQTAQFVIAHNDKITAQGDAEIKLAIAAAWHTAAWGRVKRMEPLDAVMRRLDPREDAPEAVAAGIRAAFGIED